MKRERCNPIIWLMAIVVSGSACAACTSDDPVAIAQSFYAKHRQFASENPEKIKSIVAPRMFDALHREFECSRGQICAIETDPWTDAQDGSIEKPIEFTSAKTSDTKAEITMTYRFVLDKSHREQRHATLVLQRTAPTECWLIGDLVGPDGDSLVKSLEDWQKEYGDGN